MPSSTRPDLEVLLKQIEDSAAELRKAISSYQTIAAADGDETEAESLSKRISNT